MQIFTFCPSLPPVLRPLSVVSRRGACGATACTGAAAIRYPGSRSPESWREEQHPTPHPPPPPPPPRPDTLLSPPCRGRTWSRRTTRRSLLPLWPPLPPALLGTGADLITLPPALQPLPVTSENSAGTQCVTQRGKVPSDPRWRETSVIRKRATRAGVILNVTLFLYLAFLL